jgi:hypothetical protein
VKMRFFGAVLLLSLIASNAFALTINCRDLFVTGLQASMRIELPPDVISLREAFRQYASTHDLLFWSNDDRGGPLTHISVETRRNDVDIKIEIASGNATADVGIETTCYADAAWEPLWREIQAFIALKQYRILDTWDRKAAREQFVQQLLQNLPLAPLTPVNTE